MSRLTLIFIYFNFYVVFGYWNRTIPVLDYDPIEICDSNDPWNQSKFGGLGVPFRNFIISKTSINTSEIAYHCVNNIPLFLLTILNLTTPQYDSFLFCPNGIIEVPHLKLFDILQPYQEFAYSIVVNYEEPEWLVFRYMDTAVVGFFVCLPLILGIVFGFVSEKHPTQCLVSDYYGLIFFQPDYLEKRNISLKIITLTYKLTSLIVVTIFLYSLQNSFQDLITSGGKNFSTGLAGVHVIIEQEHMNIVLNKVTIPKDSGYFYMGPSDWKSFLSKNEPGATYLMSEYLAEILSYQFCNLIFLGHLFKASLAFFAGYMTTSFRQELNEAILDASEFDIRSSAFRYSYRQQQYSKDELIPLDQIKCHTARKQNLNPRFSIHHFKELWIIYIVGVVIASLYKIGHLLMSFVKKNKRYVVDEIRQSRTNKIIKKLEMSIDISFMWVIRYQYHFIFGPFVGELKKVRFKIIATKPQIAQKLEKLRAKIVRESLKGIKKRTYIKIIKISLIGELNSKKTSINKRRKSITSSKSRMQKNFLAEKLRAAKKIIKNKKHEKKTSYYSSIIDVALKEKFFRGLQINKLFEFYNESQIHSYVYKRYFLYNQLVKHAHESKPKFMIEEKMFKKMKSLFGRKIYQKINRFTNLNQNKQNLLRNKDQIQKLYHASSSKSIKDTVSDFIQLAKSSKAALSNFKQSNKRVKKLVKCADPQAVPQCNFKVRINNQINNDY